MIRKNYFTFLFTTLVFLAASSAALAQSGPIRGEVVMKKDDGTTVPVADAIVEAFRTDIDKGKLPDTKTNKRGEFSFAGALLGSRYVISVSAPGIRAAIEPNVKAHMENIVITVVSGDGRRASETEVREALKGVSSTGGELTEEQKRQQAENEKKVAEMDAANKKAESANKVINAAVKAGADAFNAKNYDLAIAEYTKGIDAAPDFVGSAPTFLSNRGLAYQKRALNTYNESVKGDSAMKAAAPGKMNPDFTSALADFNRGLEILKATTPGDAAEQKNAAQNRVNLLANALETHGYAARLAPDGERDEKANAILEQYIAAESDQAKRTAALLNYATNMNGAGQLKNAAIAYRKVLEISPDNLDALAGLGLALYSDGFVAVPPDKDVLQEGLNYMQKFVDTAPDTHQLKQSVKETIEELKSTQKLAPQKTAPPRKKG